MDQKFFRVPFASNGDTQAIPETAASDGSVSYPSGWGPDYAKDPAADANAKPVEREAMNTVLNAITGAIRQYQTNAYPEWITTANNNGAAFAYDAGVVVEYNGALYLSLAGNNTATPGADATKWQVYIQREATEEEAIAGEGSTQVITPRRLHAGASYLDEQLKTALTPYLLPVGAIVMWGSETPPDGWLELNGQEFDTEQNPKLALMYPDGVVPDYRGRFVRAWSNGSTIDADRELGSVQSDEVGPHSHILITGRFGTRADSYGPQEGALHQCGNSGTSLAAGRIESGEIQENTGSETRPINIAAMYIIKTDLAESENSGSTTPTALVISPSAVTINAGTTRQFAGTVLPAALSADYPVSWAVSDPTLGSIDSNGLYSSTAGKSGTQTIIASLSTGLTATATVTQHVYLTTISIGAIPAELLAGNTYAVPVTYSPTSYTETVNSASSDPTVATLAADGTLTISGAGTATLSLTGASSGVTASITITATEEEVPEIYLQIENNLSEISAGGAVAQGQARNALGLGDLATKDSLSATDVNAVPQASATLGTEDLNTVTSPGRKFQSLTSNATAARHYPVALAGMLDVIKTTGTGIRQIYYPYNTTDVYHRYCVDTATQTFGAWEQSGGDFLAIANNLSDVADAAESRENLGVSYTISTDVAPTDATGYANGHVWYQTEA
ncbi:phage tail protein [Brenneria roseae subsp. americana]|uniref:Phage tail protein n=1 Tax=Brenneria roseae subsp. americana TaxID=1508507 RepID=A0A2U1TMN8_9GAMM|nr:tail fiber protein [Brenneria roseae]PWC10639.1 phage tail protein [Brenneria roseae subsp. americana]